MGKNILAVMAAVIFGNFTILLIEGWGHSVYPMPTGQDMKAYIETAPVGALLFPTVAHALGAVLGGLIAAMVAKSDKLAVAMIAGGIFQALGIALHIMFYLQGIRIPVGLLVLDLVVYLPASVVGYKIWSLTRSSTL